jgi:hypothetical protein
VDCLGEEMKGFIILVTKTKGVNCPLKQMSTNYISINWEQLKKDKGNFGADQKRRYIGGYVTEDNRYSDFGS